MFLPEPPREPPLAGVATFIEHLADIVLLVDPSDGRILGANAVAESAYGYTKRELLSFSIRDLVVAETPSRVGEFMAQADASGHRFESQHQRKGGERFPVEVNSRGFTEGGRRVLISVIRDISEKHRMLAALKEAESKRLEEFERAEQRLRFFKTAIDRAPICAYWMDSAGRFVYVNDAASRTLGYTRDELLQMRIMDIARGSEALWVRIFDSIKTHGASTRQSRHYCKNGEAVDVEIHSFHLHYDGMDYSIGFALDIRQRLGAEREREVLLRQFNQAQKMESVGRLAGGIAHDFNNVLTVIQMSTEEMLQRVEAAPCREALAVIKDAGKRASALTRQLLTFARRQAIAPQVLDLNVTVEGMIGMLGPLLGENLELDWQPQPDLWSVSIDPSQFDQLLSNLCVNARDAITDVGRIVIRTGNRTIGAEECLANPGFAAGAFVELSVSDNGCGMDDATMSSIFEPFFTTKPEGKGTGLGLATVYGIVKQNGGFIGVSSVVGEGTTFSIYLPRVEGQAAACEVIPAAHSGKVRGETILVVEDEPGILKLVARVLQKEGYSVLAAQSPSEALAAVKKHDGPIHLLITDVIMPGMNGRDLSRLLGADRPSLKSLFMSGYAADVIAPQSAHEKAVAYIGKPFAIEDLLAKVRAVLD
jgi:PAS domain S-box-containing protein